MNIKIRILTLLLLASILSFGQTNLPKNISINQNEKQAIENRHSIGASFFMMGNFLSDSPNYYLLTYGYRLTQKDRIFLEFNTWRYAEPLGTYGHSSENYPGFVRASGIGFGYQRFHWKGLFTTIEVTPFSKQYYDINNKKIQKGFQMYLQIITGYRFELFNKRWYIEPAYALKYWPVDTNYPSEFAEIELGRPKYIFEPSLNFGFKFR